MAKEKGPRVYIGSIVLIRDENMPPLKWKIGIVVDVRTGNDGVIRPAVGVCDIYIFCMLLMLKTMFHGGQYTDRRTFVIFSGIYDPEYDNDVG